MRSSARRETGMIHRRLKYLIFISLVISISACAAPATLAPAATSAPTLAPTIAVAPAASDFDAARAYEYNRALAVTIGTRVAGTESGIKAGDYIAQQFKSFGYKVDKQAFPFEYWENVDTRASAQSSDARDLKTVRPIQYSPSGHFAAEIISVGGVGSDADFAKVNVKEKIALVMRGSIPFADKAKNAANAGALAVLIYNNAAGTFQGTLQTPSAIPTLGMSREEGLTLLDLLDKGAVKIKLDSDTRVRKNTGYNIIATKPGANGKTILMGGHYDTVETTTGAGDNGSGTAVLIELARVLAQKPNQSALIFVAFDAEEFGLLGSRFYADNLSEAERGKIIGMLNFDMLGGGSGPLLAGGNGALGQTARDAAKSIGIDARNFALGGGAGSDHQSFQRIGIDTVFFSRDYDLLHTPQDVLDQIHAEWLGEAGRAGVKTVEMLDAK
ncbi:MAG: M28 family peptidase [Chloroflexi bacterium]|nr:M28 family peptidase [Chloroflexota bacterium]